MAGAAGVGAGERGDRRLRRSGACGPARDGGRRSSGHSWWPSACGIRDGACAPVARVEKSASRRGSTTACGRPVRPPDVLKTKSACYGKAAPKSIRAPVHCRQQVSPSAGALAGERPLRPGMPKGTLRSAPLLRNTPALRDRPADPGSFNTEPRDPKEYGYDFNRNHVRHEGLPPPPGAWGQHEGR